MPEVSATAMRSEVVCSAGRVCQAGCGSGGGEGGSVGVVVSVGVVIGLVVGLVLYVVVVGGVGMCESEPPLVLPKGRGIML